MLGVLVPDSCWKILGLQLASACCEPDTTCLFGQSFHMHKPRQIYCQAYVPIRPRDISKDTPLSPRPATLISINGWRNPLGVPRPV